MFSPNQVLTHAARAAAKQLNKLPPPMAARGAREGLWLEKVRGSKLTFLLFEISYLAKTADGYHVIRRRDISPNQVYTFAHSLAARAKGSLGSGIRFHLTRCLRTLRARLQSS